MIDGAVLHHPEATISRLPPLSFSALRLIRESCCSVEHSSPGLTLPDLLDRVGHDPVIVVLARHVVVVAGAPTDPAVVPTHDFVFSAGHGQQMQSRRSSTVDTRA